jgi:3,4-dihydroxy 2-butanone 4-phosphate synthase/GTP cyclohydrolase II
VFLEELDIQKQPSTLPFSGFQIGRVIVEIMNEDGTMARLPQLAKVAKKFDLKWSLSKRLVAYRMQ